jgi:ketosteroid isomerase-like protein
MKLTRLSAVVQIVSCGALFFAALPLTLAAAAPAGTQPRPVSAHLRRTLLEAREAVWRAFYQKDPSVIEELLPPELIAIDEWEEKWRTRDDALADYKKVAEQKVKLTRLEFPRTEIQVFGDTAILYSQFVYETEANGNRSTSSGRGTEIFVRRHGKWVNVGWHLDSCLHMVAREGLRKTLLAAREAVWRAYFSNDPLLDQVVGAETVAFEATQDKWRNHDEFLADAKKAPARLGKLVRLEFPHTEIRIYDETAIMYSSYVYETELDGKRSGPVSGRATEVFTLREGKWVNVGRHVDSGPTLTLPLDPA